MINRCYNPKSKAYKDYGGRGITVCPQWRYNFKQFYADMAPRPDGKTIDRYPDNDGNYEPGNCRWATRKEQQRHQRVTRKVIIEGSTYIAADLADISGHKTDIIVARAKAGLSYKEVVDTGRSYNLNGFKLGAAISAAKRKARTHCKRGHLYPTDPDKMRTNGKYTWRGCDICHELRRKERIETREKEAHEWLERNEGKMPKTTKAVTCPEDVINLGWEGNFALDAHKFQLVDDYIINEPDLYKRQLADLYASIYGMGVQCEIDPTYDPRESILNREGG